MTMGFETIEPIEPRQKNTQNMFAAPITSSTKSSSHSISDQPSSSRKSKSAVTSPVSNSSSNFDGAAQKKFGGAKAISSDQFFDNEASSFERSANLSRFQGSNSISSSDYFGDGQTTTSNRSGSSRSNFKKIIDIKILYK